MQYNAREIIDTLMAEKGLTQAKLAQLAQISQSTISRLRRGEEHERNGEARLKLLHYAETQDLAGENLAQAAPKRIVRAFRHIWDGSPDHLDAIVKILHDLAPFRRSVSEVKGRSRDRQRRETSPATQKHRP